MRIGAQIRAILVYSNTFGAFSGQDLRAINLAVDLSNCCKVVRRAERMGLLQCVNHGAPKLYKAVDNWQQLLAQPNKYTKRAPPVPKKIINSVWSLGL